MTVSISVGFPFHSSETLFIGERSVVVTHGSKPKCSGKLMIQSSRFRIHLSIDRAQNIFEFIDANEFVSQIRNGRLALGTWQGEWSILLYQGIESFPGWRF